MRSISRREFLKLGGLALTSLAFTSFLPEFTGFEDGELARVATTYPAGVPVYLDPDDQSLIVRNWERDSLVHVYDSVTVPTNGATDLWYRVFGGYMNAARMQAVKVHYNIPLSSIPKDTKILSELTVPYTEAYRYDQWNGWYTVYRLYYSSTQWITGIDTGPDGKAWYVIQDEADKNMHYYVPAEQLRPIDPSEYTPTFTEVPPGHKRIEVNLTTQTLTCYESNQQVFSTLVSTGQGALLATPARNFYISVKLPSRNMSSSSPLADDIYPLVGVPWTSFVQFEDMPFLGHAFHGTYWHDNFGYTMSHGCINMRNADALWLYRWCTPAAGYDQINLQTLDVKGYGTTGNIHY